MGRRADVEDTSAEMASMRPRDLDADAETYCEDRSLEYSWNNLSGTAMVDSFQHMQDGLHGCAAHYVGSLMGALWLGRFMYVQDERQLCKVLDEHYSCLSTEILPKTAHYNKITD